MQIGRMRWVKPSLRLPEKALAGIGFDVVSLD